MASANNSCSFSSEKSFISVPCRAPHADFGRLAAHSGSSPSQAVVESGKDQCQQIVSAEGIVRSLATSLDNRARPVGAIAHDIDLGRSDQEPLSRTIHLDYTCG
jgi:hypothetical protein